MQELMRGDSLDTSGNNDKKKEDDSLDECLVCSDQKRDVLFTPCGHVAVRLLIFYVKKIKDFDYKTNFNFSGLQWMFR